MAKRIPRRVYNINNFPDHVLSHIISFLPTKDAIRTSVLSRRWRLIFSLTSNLDLETKSDFREERKALINFLDRLLLNREYITSRIRFRLHCHRQYLDPQRAGAWIFALVRHKIQELDLRFNCKISDCLGLLQSLFSCKSLVVLKLDSCHTTCELKVPPKICLPRLKVLHLQKIAFSNDEEILFLSCPVLEDLEIKDCFLRGDCAKFSISNQNLKRLKLGGIIPLGKTTVPILITAPNLLDFTMSNFFSYNTELVIINMKSLKNAYIFLYGGNNERVNAAFGALRQLKNTQTLKIDQFLLEELHRLNLQVPLFQKMSCLEIVCWDAGSDLIPLEYFLARCVVLETLIFHVTLVKRNTSNQYKLQKSQLAPLLDHLKTIDIQLYGMYYAEAFMPIIEFFLKNARVLKELKVCSKGGGDPPEQKLKFLVMLTSFPRTSQECRVLFAD